MNSVSAEQKYPGPLLVTLIVNYRTAELVVDCLRSLFTDATLPKNSYVVVADGASEDGSVEQIEAAIKENGWQDRTQLLPLAVNGGFSYSNNQALAHAIQAFGRPRYVLFLNPDTIVRPGALHPLLEAVETNPRIGIAGARLEDPDGTPQACAFRFPTVLGEIESEAKLGPITRLLNGWVIAPPMAEHASKIDWVSGAGMLVRTDVLDEIGRFDERYFLYYEEVDLCLRAAKAGWQCWHVPQSRIVHLVGCSTGVTRLRTPNRRPAYWFQSRRRYFLKHHGTAYLVVADLAWLSGQLLWQLRRRIERKPLDSPPHLLRDFLTHVWPSERLGLKG